MREQGVGGEEVTVIKGAANGAGNGNGYLAPVIKAINADLEQAEFFYVKFLQALGIWEIMEDEPRQRTPARVAHSYLEFFGDSLEPINFTTFPVPHCSVESCDVVSVYDIEFASLCAHHHLPFTGRCHIGYLPCEYVAGLSKLPRVVEHLTHGALIQEDVTRKIADYLFEALACHGVVVVMEATHSCMALRGVRKPGHTARTIATRGVFTTPEGETRLRLFMEGIR